jgi:hypothetical protein
LEPTSRRSFFKQAGTVAAITGAAAVVPGTVATAFAGTNTPKLPGTTGPEFTTSAQLGEGESLIVHVKNARTGEISIFVGTREVLIQDRSIAARLINATL